MDNIVWIGDYTIDLRSFGCLAAGTAEIQRLHIGSSPRDTVTSIWNFERVTRQAEVVRSLSDTV